jgi:hypothetical protein
MSVQLVFYLAHATEVLEAGRSINEAVTYSQRMYELADRDDAIPAARIHGRLLVRLGRCTEAMEVRRPVHKSTQAHEDSYLPQKSDALPTIPSYQFPGA